MELNEICVLFVLAVCCFTANVLHGLTGCGSILVLHALWQTAVTVAPTALHGTDAFGSDNVKSIVHFSYVLYFFIQIVLTGLLFFDERRTRKQQREHGIPPSPSELNGVLLLAFIPCSFIGALVGIYTIPMLLENGVRIVLGGSSLFFALTFLALYQIKYLEKKKTEDVIRDDLTLMRIQRDVQRHVILQYLEEEKRRKARRERHRRHRTQRRQAKREERRRRREMRLNALAASSNTVGATAPSAAELNASPMVLVPPSDETVGNTVKPEDDGGPLQSHGEDRSPQRQPSQSLSSSLDPATVGRSGRVLEVHGSSQSATPYASIISDVHLPASHTNAAGTPSAAAHRRQQRYFIKEANVHTYIRHRLAEMSAKKDSEDEEEAHVARLANWTLCTMEGRDGDAAALNDTSDGLPMEYHLHHGTGTEGSSNSNDSSSEGDSGEEDESTAAGSTSRHAAAAADSRAEREGSVAPAMAGKHDDPKKEKRGSRKSTPALVQVDVPDEDGDESVDLNKSIASASAAVTSRRNVFGQPDVVNIGLRESQQQQLKVIQDFNLQEQRERKRRNRLVHFVRMDGGVVVSAMVSSFFSGLLGSYTGVSSPPLSIFALAMDISVPVLRVNYAVSSIAPAALRAVVGIYDGFANTDLLVYYVVSVLFGWGGVAAGLYISHYNVVSHFTFMVTTLTTLLLVAFLMLVPITDMLLRFGATAVCVVIVAMAIFRQQKPPERRRPPAPPNTPATAAEVEAFEQFWIMHSRRQRSLLEYEEAGSTFTTPRSVDGFGNHRRSAAPLAPPSNSNVTLRQQLQSSQPSAKSEEIPTRGREENEELITVIPVHTKTRV